MHKNSAYSYFCCIYLLVFSFPSYILAANSKSASEKESKFTLKTSVVCEYDTNVLQYSRDDIDEYRSYSNPNRFNRVKSISDIETALNLSLDFKDRLFGHTFISGLEVEPHFFLRNKIKDFETYRLKLRQYLSRGEYLEFRYRKIPRYFVRNLYDKDYNAYRKFTYNEDMFILGYRIPLLKRLSVRLRYLHFIRDYNGDFNENDVDSDGINATFWQDCTRRFRVRYYFEFEKVDAKGELYDTQRIESNTSYDKFELGLRGTFGLTQKIDVYAEYSFSYRDFATDNSVSDDPYHAKRNDKIQELGCGVEYALDKNTKIFLGYRYGAKDVNVTTEDPAEINASVLGYEKSIFLLGLSHKF